MSDLLDKLKAKKVANDATRVASEVRITDPNTGGQKGQKPERFELLPAAALQEIARVYAFGAKKYADHNWAKGYDWGLSIGALERHVVEFKKCNDLDNESGLHHLAHAAFHCLTLITFSIYGLGTDSRLRIPAKKPDGGTPPAAPADEAEAGRAAVLEWFERFQKQGARVKKIGDEFIFGYEREPFVLTPFEVMCAANGGAANGGLPPGTISYATIN